ncbi:carbohydrate-binding protein, putative [Phytophthora infestans T30-4]|uniref:Carbohydrate-binding protein, putative n=1 Tax=Phytophthora infestans (strain T30-4) TaxID=403677 RepID=D0N4Y0_PHYIT|nr:carbohydrate-binding protein, putative [Phytophthora infestans T30-4]EEY69938.1 carbohydrate-binding protein, putative [Phytophthora infestans T30-4]|eukprot:XP_002998585.1 carbohydrate-binding protein, putative [Phytophthora infestans T30-4]
MVRSPPRYYEDASETSACYYPPDNMGPYLSSSYNQRTAPKKKERSKLMRRLVPLLCGLLVLGIVIVIVAVTLSSDSDDASNTDSGGNSTSASSTLPSSCSPVDSKDRTVAFWQSEVAGCDTVPDGVTHVVFGFALVADGVIVPTFQTSDATITQCVEKLRERCILTMGSIGGSTNNDNMSAVANATLFAESAAALMTKFGFDGLDLDDETVGSQFSANRTVGLLKATREALDATGSTSALLTYDAYFYEGDASVCSAEETAAYSRCFPSGVLDYVDWVNIMAYNVNLDNATAAAIYAAAVSTTFAAWGTQLGGNFSLATIGLCVGGGCAYGPGPNTTVIAEWETFSRQEGYGGMMIYSASAEVADDYPATRSIVSATA